MNEREYYVYCLLKMWADDEELMKYATYDTMICARNLLENLLDRVNRGIKEYL